MIDLIHDKETCTRIPCGKCRPQGKPNVPVVKTNPHDAAKPSPGPDVLGPLQFAASLERTEKHLRSAMGNLTALPPRLKSYGATTWRRVVDWELLTIPKGQEDDEDPEAAERRKEATPDDKRDNLKEAAQAAHYADELRRLLRRIAARQRLIEKATLVLDADLSRLDRLVGITNPEAPARVLSRDMLAAQVAADGWCVSCWRDDQDLTEITKRQSGEPFYRDLCRPCGEWKAANGELPPMDELRQMHGKRRRRVNR